MRTVMLVFGLAFGACAVALFCALQMGALGGKGGGSRQAVQPSRQRQRKGAMRVAADDYDEEYGDSEDEEEFDEEAEDVEVDDILGDDDDEFDRALERTRGTRSRSAAIVPRRPPSDVVNTGDEQPVGRGAAEEGEEEVEQGEVTV